MVLFVRIKRTMICVPCPARIIRSIKKILYIGQELNSGRPLPVHPPSSMLAINPQFLDLLPAPRSTSEYRDIKIYLYLNTMLCQNLEAMGEKLSEILNQ